mgnify:CR=1 FL=1
MLEMGGGELYKSRVQQSQVDENPVRPKGIPVDGWSEKGEHRR